MSRLPNPGSDDGTWGDILNNFLSVEHNADGTLKKAADIADAKTKADSAVTTAQLGVAGGVAQLDSSSKLVPAQVPDLSSDYVPQPTALPADGQLLAWSATLGQWTSVAPTGTSELASAVNSTATTLAVSASSGLGAVVVIPGTAISVSTSGGRPVTFHFGTEFYQIVAGTGTCFLTLQETTSGGVTLGGAINELPNVAYGSDAPSANQTMIGQWSLGGPITSTRTFRLVMQLYASSGSSPTVNLANNSAFPSFLRAVAG